MSPPPEKEFPPASGWFSAVAFVAAAVCVGYAIHIRDGEYWPSAIHWVGAAVLLTAAGVAFPRVRHFRWSGGAVLAAVVAVLLFQFYLLATDSPGGSNWWNKDLQNTSRGNFLFYAAALRVAWAAVDLCIWRIDRWGGWAFALLLAAHLSLGAWMIRTVPNPPIDVYVFQQVGGQALLRGDNPYAITFPDIYRETGQTDRPVYGKGLTKDGRVAFGFPYPPLSLLLSTAGYAAAVDHRYAQLLAMTLAAALIAAARPGRLARLAAAGLLFTPRGLFVLGRGWTEPFVVLGLAAVVFARCRTSARSPKSVELWGGDDDAPENRRPIALIFLGITLGLFLVSKQYLVAAVPAVFVLYPLRRWRLLLVVGGIAAAVGAAVTLPLAAWDWRAFVHSTYTVQKVAPFRDDALSYLVWYARRTGDQPCLAFAFAALVPAADLALHRARRGAAGFAATLALLFLPFIALNKQAFANYYYFVIGALWTAVAVTPIEPEGKAPIVA